MCADHAGSPSVEPSLVAARARIAKLLPRHEVASSEALFDAVALYPRASRKFRRVAQTGDAEQVRDLLAELRYAAVYRALGYAVAFEPSGTERGPDFAAVRGDESFAVEVRRFRAVGPQVLPLGSDDELAPYGRGGTDVQRALGRIVEKFGQVGEGLGVIALWSDDDGIEEIEVDLAVRALREEERSGIRRFPAGLSWIVYGSSWVLPGQQLFCFPLREVPRPPWCDRMENLTLATVLADSERPVPARR